MMNLNKRVVTGAALAGAAIIAVSGAGAGVAEAKKLPGATKTRSFDEGSVSMRLFDESFTVRRAVTRVGTSREVWVSGKVVVKTGGDVEGGNVRAGYIVGCQAALIAGTEGTGGVELDGPNITGESAITSTVGLAPGVAKYVPVINLAVGGDAVDSFDFADARGGIAYSQERFGVDGCAAHASARAMVTARVETKTFKGNITMYGKPFSLG